MAVAPVAQDVHLYIDNVVIAHEYIDPMAQGTMDMPGMTSPTQGTTITTETVQFEWTPGSGVSEYWLRVGTNPGAVDIYYQSTQRNTTSTVTGIPLKGQPVYVRLWYKVNGEWLFKNYMY
ncbi:MAG: hypothetical protein MRK02_13820 [Candidatus Scalindua sp.]|nr:hypothetical protein [Candidatus Scalindua sp.]